MNILSFFQEVSQRRARGENLAIATVVGTGGSTPREKGARMAVTMGGEIIGTVGGGYPESEAINAARQVLVTGLPKLVHVEMTADASAAAGAICGGSMDMFIELVGSPKS